MKTYQRPETVICEAVITNPTTGAKTDPDTSIKVEITNPAGTVVQTAIAMTKDAVGEYHYDYAPGVSAVLGVYVFRVTAVHGGRTSIHDDVFELT